MAAHPITFGLARRADFNVDNTLGVPIFVFFLEPRLRILREMKFRHSSDSQTLHCSLNLSSIFGLQASQDPQSLLRVLSVIGFVVFAASIRLTSAAQPYLERYGDPGTWGKLGSREHYDKLASILDDRTAYAQSLSRTDVYILQSPLGSPSGGGGNGSIANPYLAKDTTDLQALINAASPYTALRLKGVFRSDGPRGVGLFLNKEGFALMRWPGQSERWFVTAFQAPYGDSGWTTQDLGSSILYSRPEIEPVYWVKIGNTEQDVDRYPCRLSSSITDVSANISTELAEWYWDAQVGMLYVNLPKALIDAGRVSIQTAEPMKHAPTPIGATRCGIQTLDADGILIQGGVIEGFGYDRQQNGNWPVTLTCRGNQLQQIDDCVVRFGWYHTLGGLSSAAGGIRVYSNCTVSYCRAAPAGVSGGGDFTSFVDYAGLGGQEIYMDNVRFVSGTLPDGDWPDLRRASPMYSHTGGGIRAAISIRRNVDITDTPLSGFSHSGQFSDQGTMFLGVPSRRDSSRYRSFVLDEKVELSEMTGSNLLLLSGSGNVYYNCDWSARLRPGAAANERVVVSEPMRGFFLNCSLGVIVEDGNWLNSQVSLVSNRGGFSPPYHVHDCDWVFSKMWLKRNAGSVNLRSLSLAPTLVDEDWGTHRCGFFGTIFANLSGVGMNPLNLPEGDPLFDYGSRRSAYTSGPDWGFDPTDFDGNAFASMLDQPVIEPVDLLPTFVLGAADLPAGTLAEFDVSLRQRGSLAAPGPVSPRKGACLINSDCLLVLSGQCAAIGGAWMGEGVACAQTPSEAIYGGCCVGAACRVMERDACGLAYGLWQGELQPCPAPGSPEACCPEDVNLDQVLGVSDIFQFLSKWFSSLFQTDPSLFGFADWNRDRVVRVDDIFAFLSDWFNGCR